LTAWYFNLYFLVIIIVLAVSAYLMGIYESRNIWDYLIDPALTLFAFFWLIIWMIKRVVQYQSFRRQTHNVVEKSKPPKNCGVPIQEKA